MKIDLGKGAFLLLVMGSAISCSQKPSSSNAAINFKDQDVGVRYKELLAKCEEIAAEKDIATARYNATIEAYNIRLSKDQSPVSRCS